MDAPRGRSSAASRSSRQGDACRPHRLAQQAGHRQTMPGRERRPDECRHRTVVADERGYGPLRVVDLDEELDGHDPYHRLEPDPAVAAISDLPPTDVVRRRPPRETEAAEHPPDELPGETRCVFDSGTCPLLR